MGPERKQREKCAGDEKVQEAVENEVSELVSIRKVTDNAHRACQISSIRKDHKTENEYGKKNSGLFHKKGRVIDPTCNFTSLLCELSTIRIPSAGPKPE